MKKSTLALVVMGIVASASVQAAEIYNKDGNKLDVYGKVKAMHYMSDNDSKDGDQSYIRFGFKGETQINDQLTGYGRWEAEFAGNKAESDTAQQKTRLAFAGLKYKDLGSFDYGRNLGALYDVEAWTDMFPEFGGDSSAQTDNFMTKRASGLATYRNTDFFGVIDGLNLTLQYQGKNENRDVKKQNGDGFGTSLTYDFGGSDFAISGAYTNSDRTNEQNLQSRGTGKRAEAWATGLKYDANNIYLATFYSETRKMTPITGGFANKTQNFEAVAQYQFDFGLRPSLGYVLSKGKDIEGIGETLMEKLTSSGFDTFDKLLAASEADIAEVSGFGEITAATLLNGLQENKAEMQLLISSKTIHIQEPDNGILAGKSFCFTGELSVKRSEAEKMVKDKGGSVKSSVGKGLSYLVTNDTSSGSAKNKKAAELGIPVIDETAFFRLLEQKTH